MKTDAYKKMGEWLYTARRSRRPILSETEVAKVAQVSIGTYRKWERGECAPDVVQLDNIIETYGWELPDDLKVNLG